MATKEEIQQILEYKTIAVVGISNKPDRASFGVAEYLRDAGYTIVPVNPNYDEVLSQKCYPSLSDIPFPIDIVDVFRRSEDVPPVADEAIKIGAKVLWLQLGIVNNEAKEKAEAAGLQFVQDHCLKVEHMRHSR